MRFETNRNLTGMGHVRFTSAEQAGGDRPVDHLARGLFARGGIDAIHVYSNVVTIDLSKGAVDAGLAEVIHDLFVHYRPGVVPPTDEELMAQPPTG